MFRSCPGNIQEQQLRKRGTQPTADRSLGNPCPEAVFSTYQSSNLNGSEQEETNHVVTGVQEEIRYHPHVVQEVIPYCSPGTLSGKQKNERSTSQSQFRSENTRAKTPEADQIFWALQHLASYLNSVNCNNNINRISKLPKSLTTTKPAFDGKQKKFELLEDLFQTSFKIHNQRTEDDKINYFDPLIRGDPYKHTKTSPASKEEIWKKFSMCSVEIT